MSENGFQTLRRLVLLLLVVRVVAAPITLRPAPPDDPERSTVVVRICAWPAQQARFDSEKLSVDEMPTAPDADFAHPGLPRLVARSRPDARSHLPSAFFLRSAAPLRC